MYNRKVERYSTGITGEEEIQKISQGAALMTYAANQRAKGEQALTESASLKTVVSEGLTKVMQTGITEAQIPIIMNRINREGKLAIFKDIMFEMFSKSLVLDGEVIIANESALREAMNTYIDEKGGYAFLESAIRETHSPLLKKIKSVCEAVAAHVTHRKNADLKDAKLDNVDIRFELNEDEKNELDLAKQDLNVDQIAELVKKKVVTVVKDEQQRQRKEDELYQDLEDQAREDGITVQEAFDRVIVHKSPVQEGTLFNALFRSSYKEFVSENVAIAAALDPSDDVDAEAVNINADSTDATTDNFEKGDPYTQENQPHNNDAELISDEEMKIDMDLLLAEALTRYTMMELSYTIKLENYNYADLQKMTRGLLN